MTRYTHNIVFGWLAIAALLMIAGGFGWFMSAQIVPAIIAKWPQIMSEFEKVPGGVVLMTLGLVFLVVVYNVGNALERRL